VSAAIITPQYANAASNMMVVPAAAIKRLVTQKHAPKMIRL
jgi:hypothetical protein